jgi:hypothetical protein
LSMVANEPPLHVCCPTHKASLCQVPATRHGRHGGGGKTRRTTTAPTNIAETTTYLHTRRPRPPCGTSTHSRWQRARFLLVQTKSSLYICARPGSTLSASPHQSRPGWRRRSCLWATRRPTARRRRRPLNKKKKKSSHHDDFLGQAAAETGPPVRVRFSVKVPLSLHPPRRPRPPAHISWRSLAGSETEVSRWRETREETTPPGEAPFTPRSPRPRRLEKGDRSSATTQPTRRTGGGGGVGGQVQTRPPASGGGGK